METTFDCPKCGAPLSFTPHPGDETVECSFCHETVIIPEDLRIPLPRPPRVRPEPVVQPRKTNWLVSLFAFIGVILFILMIIGFAVDSSDSTTSSSSDSPTADLSSATQEAQATATALLPLLTKEQNWPASFTEKFMDNSHSWETGDKRDSYITGNRSISDGIYTWNITAVQSRSDFSFPDMPDQTDFYASVDMKFIHMPDDADTDAGLVFRYNSTDNSWYYFSVNNQGQYYFGRYDGSDWFTLIPETESAAIHQGQANHLEVGAQGAQFIFSINGEMVDHFVNESLKSGTIGVGINLAKAGEKATVEFSNFTVQSPAPAP